MKKLHVLALSIMTATSFGHLQAMDSADVKITETKVNWAKTLKNILIEPGIKLGISIAALILSIKKTKPFRDARNKEIENWAMSSQYARFYDADKHDFDNSKIVADLSTQEIQTFNKERFTVTWQAASHHPSMWGDLILISGVCTAVYLYKFLRKLYSEREIEVIEKNIDKEIEAESTVA